MPRFLLVALLLVSSAVHAQLLVKDDDGRSLVVRHHCPVVLAFAVSDRADQTSASVSAALTSAPHTNASVVSTHAGHERLRRRARRGTRRMTCVCSSTPAQLSVDECQAIPSGFAAAVCDPPLEAP